MSPYGFYQRSMGIWWSPTKPFVVLGTGAMPRSAYKRANVPVPALAVNHNTEGVGVWAEHLRWAAPASLGIFLGASTCAYRSSWAPPAPPASSPEPSFRGARGSRWGE